VLIDGATMAAMRQVGRRMPAAHGLFDEEDMRGDEVGRCSLIL
jgi:hypothetical protein